MGGRCRGGRMLGTTVEMPELRAAFWKRTRPEAFYSSSAGRFKLSDLVVEGDIVSCLTFPRKVGGHSVAS